MTEPIDLEMARTLLRQAMEVQGRDFVYNKDPSGICYYRPISPGEGVAKDDPRIKTGCLVGEALARAGETRHRPYVGGVPILHESYPGMMTQVASEYFRVAQDLQDRGRTWGEAFDAAESFADSV